MLDRTFFDDTLRFCLEWFAKMNATLTVAEEIIKSTRSLVAKYLSGIGDKMKACNSKEEMLQCFEYLSFEVLKSLELLDTTQKVKVVARNKGLFSEPKQFIVRDESVQILGELEEEQSMGTIMPIEHKVKSFLEMPGVLDSILTNQTRMLESPFPNLVNGEIGRNILQKSEGKTTIFLGIYQDDFNPDNPLGPHNSSTRLSAYYYSYPTLPEHLAFRLANIFLAIVHKSKDVNSQEVLDHGIDPAIYALWNAFRPLEIDEIELKIGGKKRRVHLALSQFYGDNLGLNTSLGFSRGFRAKYCCRICQINSETMKTCLDVALHLLRREDNFNECLGAESKEEGKGVLYDSWLNMFKFFKVYTNFSVDIMHDVFLGVFKYDLKAILNYYISRGVFTLNEFNQKKKSFEYGKKDRRNLSADIKKSNWGKTLKLNAKEMWTLFEYLPLMLDSLVPNSENCSVFKFVVQTVDVLDNITRKQYSNEQIMEMEHCIREHHRMYLELFNETLTIKFHLMLHYGYIVRLVGPLRSSMTFRFESKHQELKGYAYPCKSRRDLPLSICRKLCFNFALKKMDNPGLPEDVSEIKAHSTKHQEWIPSDQRFKIASSLRFKGIYFDIEDIIQTDNAFFIIRGICNYEQKVMFYAEMLDCQYKPNLRSYEIQTENTAFFVEIFMDEVKSNPVNSHTVGEKN